MQKRPGTLKRKSEVLLRNIVVTAMVIYFTVFLIVPIIIAFAGSFHNWNPLSGTYDFLGLKNYTNVFTSGLFWTSMLNTVIFSVVVIIFRVGLGLSIACALNSALVKHKSFFRAVYYYDEAFVKYNFGYASALSFVLFVITAFFTWLSFRVSGNQE